MIVEELIREIGAGPSGPGIAAVFDFDGTLIDGYSAAALYEHRFRNLELGPGELLRMVRASTGPTLTEEQFTGLVHDGIRGWVGRPESELLELGERLFAGGIAGSLFHEAWRLVESHQRAGHTVLIATSATLMQVAPLARELGVEHVLCTRLATRDGRLTGRIEGAAPWGEGKIAAVRDFFQAHGIDAAASHAYANGDEDVPLLAGVGRPHPVNPRPELAAEAARRGWPALRFHSGHTGRFDPAPALRTATLFGALFASAGAGIALGALNRDRRLGVDIATAMFDALAGPLTDIRVEVVGARHAWSHRPAVFFINHQSTMIDFLVTTRVIRTGFTAVAKAEVKQMPVVGALFDMAGVAFLDRANRDRAIEALRPAVRTLRSGTSVVMAPEGTRSLTPRLGPFKKGGFHLAAQAGVPIVPIVIRNAGEIMWRNARTARAGTVQAAVLPPISTDGWTPADIDAQVHAVRRLYLETMADWPTR
ncbi:HAD-IB family hydrolase [Pseudonocardia eucalypti]|uniref:HAD-IB family hydrolase n=1 Tax=Pseudonocardia eucalypti TaxID=648755 RepID=A0ABP9RB46_9PSEU|nr:putative phosphoserine phosphatase/1-acylglycerol-3-phosphate O-acyltransferase [Pseudonocardia eucalypti]